MFIRVDLVFSYWILAWYIAYMAKLTPYNPKWAFILGIIENIVLAIALVLYGGVISSVVLFLLVNLILKGLPLYTIYNTKSTITDIYSLIGLFVIYAIWVHLNGTTVIQHNIKIFQSVLRGKNETPSMWIINKLRTTLHI
jgi:hypothetical protein